MEQKVIYKLFLIIGSILMINSSCEKQNVDKIVMNTYNYINNSGKQLQMKIYSSSDKLISNNEISVGDTLSFELKAEGGAGPFQFEMSHGDSIYVNFSNERYQIYRKDYDSIFFEKGYNKTKISDKELQLFYVFTTKDFENATVIE